MFLVDFALLCAHQSPVRQKPGQRQSRHQGQHNVRQNRLSRLQGQKLCHLAFYSRPPVIQSLRQR